MGRCHPFKTVKSKIFVSGQEKWKDLIIPYYQNIKIVPYDSIKMERNTVFPLSHCFSLGDFWVRKSNHNSYISSKVLIWTLQNTRKTKHFLKRVYKPWLNFWSLDWLCMLSEFKTVNKDFEFWWLVYTQGEGKHVSSLGGVVNDRKHIRPQTDLKVPFFLLWTSGLHGLFAQHWDVCAIGYLKL